MTTESQRIAIAELQGWSEITCGPFGQCYGTAPFDSMMDDRQIGMPVPSYTSDLNAMHEAEKVLWEMEPVFLSAYCERLMKSRYPNEWGMAWGYIHATAAQRAEAFLRTLGRWKDDK